MFYQPNWIVIRVIYFIPLIILLFLTIRPISRLKTDLKSSPNEMTKDNFEFFIIFLLIALGFSTLLIYGLSFFPPFANWQESRTYQLQGFLSDFFNTFLLLGVVVGILAPLAEEIIFRYLFVYILDKYSCWSIGIKAGLATWCFWIAHFLGTNLFSTDPYTNTLMLEVMCGGIIFFTLYYKSRSLIFPILLHMFWNSLQSLYIILDQFFIGQEATMVVELLVAIVALLIGLLLVYRNQMRVPSESRHDILHITITFVLAFSIAILINIVNLIFLPAFITLVGANPNTITGSFITTLAFILFIIVIIPLLEKKKKANRVEMK
jgi:membrane protease YdiL (CAAX protease family)